MFKLNNTMSLSHACMSQFAAGLCVVLTCAATQPRQLTDKYCHYQQQQQQQQHVDCANTTGAACFDSD